MRKKSSGLAFALIVMLSCIPTVGRSQDWPAAKYEFAVSAGFFTGRSLQDKESLLADPEIALYEHTDAKSTPAIFLTFQRTLSPRFVLGFSLGTGSGSGKLNNETGGRNVDYSWRTYTVAVEARFVYLDRRFIRLYGLAGTGPNIYRQVSSSSQRTGGVFNASGRSEEIELGTAYQITPIGIRCGTRIAGFAEVGFGYKGALNVGASVRF